MITDLLIFLICLQESICQRVLLGRVHHDYTKKNSWASDHKKCHQLMCNKEYNCAVSYNLETKKCLHLSLTAQLVYFARHNKDFLKNETIHQEWRTIVSKPRRLHRETPEVLWMQDSVSKGKNLGSKGKRLNCRSIGVAWKQAGPSHSSARGLLFAKKVKSSGFSRKNVVWLRQRLKRGVRKKVRLFTLRNGFTITMWIKTTSRKKKRMLINNATWMLYYKGADFWLLSSSAGDKLATDLDGNRSKFDYISVADNSTRGKWKHVAYVFKNKNDVTFYTNAQRMGMSKTTQNPKFVENTLFVLWSFSSGSKYDFDGSMACITLHERALSAVDIRTLKNNCL